MIHIDGSQKSGSGTMLRYAVGLSCLIGESLHMTNIRAKRKKPGLRPQHLKAVLACKEVSGGSIEGAELGASEIIFRPGKRIKGGRYEWDIGTAGSTTMLSMTVLPLACFAGESSTFRIQGGLFQDFAPSAFHMQHALFPILTRMDINAHLEIVRPGYVPEGNGVIEVRIQPPKGKIKPLNLLQQGRIREIKGLALSSHLQGQKVSERMAKSCNEILGKERYETMIEPIYDTSSVQRGAALAVYAQTDTGCIIGSDMAGKVGRSSEEIGRYVAKSLLEDIKTGATVDRYLGDQLIIYAALAEGRTEYLIPRMTEHIDTNLWLVERILGAKVKAEDLHLKIEGIGYSPS